MAKVTNLTDRGVPILRWRVLPNGHRVINPAGVIVDGLPPEVAYSPQAKRLADKGILQIEGYGVKSPKVNKPNDMQDLSEKAPEPEAEPAEEAPAEETADASGKVRRRRRGSSKSS